MAIFLIAAPLSAMFAEPFYEAVLDHLGVKTENWAVPVVTAMFEVFASEWFMYGSLASIGVGVGIWLNRAALRFDINKQRTVELSARKETVPLADVAAMALSRVRDTPSHVFFNYNARTPTDELRRMADFITKQHSVYGHIPGTGVEQIIRPETYFFAVNANGHLIARTSDSAEEAAFVDIRVSKDQVEPIIESVIARCKALNGEDAVPDGEGMM